MEYRLGSADDIDRICKLAEDAILAMEEQGIYQWDELYPCREDFETDIAGKYLYTVWESDRFIAIYVLNTECDPEYADCEWEKEDAKYAVLHRLCVAPEVQHSGFGSRILEHIENQAREMGFDSIRLDAFSKNPFAMRMYDKAGYKQRGFADWRMGRFYIMEKLL